MRCAAFPSLCTPPFATDTNPLRLGRAALPLLQVFKDGAAQRIREHGVQGAVGLRRLHAAV